MADIYEMMSGVWLTQLGRLAQRNIYSESRLVSSSDIFCSSSSSILYQEIMKALQDMKDILKTLKDA
jgi:hypothetical protein